MVTEMHYENDEFQYQYEFENGENISLKKLRDLTGVGDKFMAEKKYDLAADAYSKAKNNYPTSLPENIHLNKSIANCVNYLKELEEKERIINEKQQLVVNNSMHNVMKEKTKSANNTQISNENGIIISSADFADFGNDYIGKEITIMDAFFSNSGQLGPWGEISNMTLRSRGNDIEDIYSMMNFSFTQKDGNDKYYSRVLSIANTNVKIRIPKEISGKMPNGESLSVDVTGVIKSNNLIEVKSIKRVTY
jgi:tetratricopeptide (TPR) repeat protein